MAPRLLLEVALRVIGIWLLALGLIRFAATAMYFLSPWEGPGVTEYLLSTAVHLASLGVIGVLLVVMAPSIAAYFYPAREGEVSPSEVSETQRIGPGHLLRIACFLFGVYLLVDTAEPAARLLANLMHRPGSSDLVSGSVGVLVQGCVGAWLVLGNQGISRYVAGLGYDPDTVPQQRVSLAVLMVLLVGFAIVLGLIRAMTTGL